MPLHEGGGKAPVLDGMSLGVPPNIRHASRRGLFTYLRVLLARLCLLTAPCHLCLPTWPCPPLMMAWRPSDPTCHRLRSSSFMLVMVPGRLMPWF